MKHRSLSIGEGDGGRGRNDFDTSICISMASSVASHSCTFDNSIQRIINRKVAKDSPRAQRLCELCVRLSVFAVKEKTK